MEIIGYSQFTPVDCESLNIVLSKLKMQNIKALELGVWVGESTLEILKYISKTNGTLDVVDTFNGEGSQLKDIAPKHDVRSAFELNTAQYADIIRIFQMTTDEAVNKVQDQYDFVYIDASHVYESIKRDIDNYYPKVKEGGILAGHDFESFEWEERDINVDCRRGKHHGVIKAVVETFESRINKVNNIWYVRK
jgi:predicted O-methyltransferase YrrM